MKKLLVWILVLISLTALILRFSDKLTQVIFGVKPTSGISIISQPADATVYINNEEAGKTHYENKNLNTGDYIVKIEKAKDFWQGKVTLTSGTITVVNRDLAADQTSSAGEILNLSKGKGLVVISNPTEADVEINGKEAGKTPVTVNLAPGEYTVSVSHPNYLRRSIQANLPADFSLTISADLALSEADLTAITTPVTTQAPQVQVKQTPTGFLRVRDKPNLAGKEISQVKIGDTLMLLEELGAWDKVRLADETEGYVSASYVEKKTP